MVGAIYVFQSVTGVQIMSPNLIRPAVFFYAIQPGERAVTDGHWGCLKKRPFYMLDFMPAPVGFFFQWDLKKKPFNVPLINKQPDSDPGCTLPTDGAGSTVFINRCLDRPT